MVGLALVSAIAVFGASLSKSATSSVDNAISADYIITSSDGGAGEFSSLGGRSWRLGPRRHRRLDGLRGGVRVRRRSVRPDRRLTPSTSPRR